MIDHASRSADSADSARPRETTTTARTGAWAVCALLWLLFTVPLFLGLDRWDLRNDEAIYAWAVDKVLETGDWLTPRIIPTDLPMLEKPPLKIWLVAGAIATGLVPHDESGMRIVDVVFGAITFGYIIAFGRRLGGTVAAAVALLSLYTYDLLLTHGFRGHHMDGALVLAYTAGLWHLLRWTESTTPSRRRTHAFVFAGYFVLGFMTKFVAIAFLPVVGLVWLVSGRDSFGMLRSRWRDWLWPAAASAAMCLPWFLYEWYRYGGEFWHIIFGQHVLARMAGQLHVEHLQPWSYYVTQSWSEFARLEGAWLVVAGLCVAGWQLVKGSALSRLLLLWWLVPFAIISSGSSKVLAYALPYIPPLALAAGWAAGLLFGFVRDNAMLLLQGLRNRMRGVTTAVERRPHLQSALIALAGICLGLAALTFAADAPLTLVVDDVRIFRNSSVVRPYLVATLVFVIIGWVRPAAQAIGVLILSLLLPLWVYRHQLERVQSVDRPLGAARDCMLAEQRVGHIGATGVFLTSPPVVGHPPLYYLQHLGAWRAGPDDWRNQVRRSLLETSTPVVMSEAEWTTMSDEFAPLADPSNSGLPSGIRAVYVADTTLLLLPGPYAACEHRVLGSGGRRFPRRVASR